MLKNLKYELNIFQTLSVSKWVNSLKISEALKLLNVNTV